jgi:hypothetical protein
MPHHDEIDEETYSGAEHNHMPEQESFQDLRNMLQDMFPDYQ